MKSQTRTPKIDKHNYITMPYHVYKSMVDALDAFFELDNDPQIHGSMPVFLRSFRDKAKTAINNVKEL